MEIKEFKLNNGLKQKVTINPKEKMIASSNGKKISVNNDFFNLNENSQISAIYHERGHLKKTIKIISHFANLFFVMFGLSMALFIIKGSFWVITDSNLNLLKTIFKNISIFSSISNWVLLTAFLVGFIGALSLKWLVELYCDFNAIKNTSKEQYVQTLKDASNYKTKLNLINKIIFWIPNKFDSIILHPPLKLRIKLLEEFD